MQLLRRLDRCRLTGMLCIALALIFAGVALSSSIDRIQHAPGASADHTHLVFSEMSLEIGPEMDHDQGHHEDGSDDQDESSPSERLPGHHHHGDSGASLIAFGSSTEATVALLGDVPAHLHDRPVIGFRIVGPDRPPKHLTISA